MSVTVTDLFCGGGGSSIGAEVAGARLVLGLNHWKRAVETHATNFQHADHDCADVSATDPRRYRPTDILLASPECTNHSLAKGAQRRKPQAGSLFDDGPAGDDEQDRSRATMWDVVRFAEAMLTRGKPYKIIVVENVVDAFKWGPDDDGSLFDAWLLAMRAVGYEHEIVYMNSMFCPPTPQSRDRMYVVFWGRGQRRPNLAFNPPSWCVKCEGIVDGQQTWKRPDRRPWGRYGVQYFYSCPECRGTVLPGVFPAASAIDWALPAQRIGDRKKPLAVNTRERIRRGLIKLDNEPFAIRLLQSGQPKPTTLPLVTLTQRHDMAMVFPVAGNTHESSPGNRARDARQVPMPTIHGTAEQAMVVPPMGGVTPRDAHGQPAPSQTTTTRSALVMANRAHGVPKDADKSPTATLCTGENIGIVEVQRNGGVRDGETRPAHTVRAAGKHHGVIMRNNTARGNSGQMMTPSHEPIRTLTANGAPQSLVLPYARACDPSDASVDPVNTLTTKDRLAIVVPAGGTWADASTPVHEPRPTQTGTESHGVAWTDGDIDDCRFRMFALHEIAEAMQMHQHVDGGEYIVTGNKRERMAQYGNAVTPPVMAQIVSRCLAAIA